MNQGVLYLNCGAKHAIHLIVSLASLRRIWQGPVAIACELSGPGREVAEACAADGRLGNIIIVAREDMQSGGKGVSYLTKTLLPKVTPFENTVFFDADTLIAGNFDELWPRSADEVVLTNFSDWVSTGHKMTGRIKEWQEVEPERVARMLSKPWPAINTGVAAWGSDTRAFADDWHATAQRRVAWITDELAAQLIFPDHNVRVVDWRHNASVVFDISRPQVADVRAWHGHGFKFWKRANAWEMYRQWYFWCVSERLAGIHKLHPGEKCLRVIPENDRNAILDVLKLTTAV